MALIRCLKKKREAQRRRQMRRRKQIVQKKKSNSIPQEKLSRSKDSDIKPIKSILKANSPPPTVFAKSLSKEEDIPKVQSHMRPIDAFMLFTQADGSFSFNTQFENTVNLKRDNIKNSIPEQITKKNLSDDIKFLVWVSVIAIAYLEVTFNDLKDEWSLISSKTKKFLLKEH